jgi:copper homeostasis protein
MSNKTKIEICVNTVESAITAQKAGVGRIILCGGELDAATTPSFGTIRIARQMLDEAELFVLIHPRKGSFLFSPTELEVMLHDVKVARQLGANGVVFSCLSANGKVDKPALDKLMNGVGEMEVNFGKAFDLCVDAQDALQTLLKAGVKRVYTRMQEDVESSITRIKELMDSGEGKITMLPYGHVTADNVEDMADRTGCREFHLCEGMEGVSGVKAALDRVSEKDAALEKLLRDAKAKKKKSRRGDDEDDED